MMSPAKYSSRVARQQASKGRTSRLWYDSVRLFAPRQLDRGFHAMPQYALAEIDNGGIDRPSEEAGPRAFGRGPVSVRDKDAAFRRIQDTFQTPDHTSDTAASSMRSHWPVPDYWRSRRQSQRLLPTRPVPPRQIHSSACAGRPSDGPGAHANAGTAPAGLEHPEGLPLAQSGPQGRENSRPPSTPSPVSRFSSMSFERSLLLLSVRCNEGLRPTFRERRG